MLARTELTCSKCRETKPLIGFARNKGSRTGYNNWCKVCNNAYSKTAHNLERRKRYRNQNIIHSLVIECRSRARAIGIPFNLEDSDLTLEMFCPVLGIPMFTGGPRTDNSPTVDRVDPRRGYIKGNVKIISWKANRLKYDCHDPAELEAIARYMREWM